MGILVFWDCLEICIEKGLIMTAHRVSKVLFCIAINLFTGLLFWGSVRSQTMEETPLMLTPEEKKWMASHSKVRIGTMDGWPPMDFVDASGQPIGIGADYVHAINRRLGGLLKIVPAPFQENLESVKEKRLDALLDVTPTPYREAYLEFTRPYLVIPHVIVARKDGRYFASEADLANATLALEKGFYSVKYFRDKYPTIEVKEYPDTARALDAVARGRADAYAGNRAVAAWVMDLEIMSTLQVQGRLEREGSVLTIGVRKDWPELASILDKALNALSMDEKIAIRRKWMNAYQTEDESLASVMECDPLRMKKFGAAALIDRGKMRLRLTSRERQWLNQAGPIRMAVDPNWLPIEWINPENGNHEGIAADYIQLISHITGIDFELVSTHTWKASVEMIDTGKADMLAACSKTEKREKMLDFSIPYLELPNAVVMKNNVPFLNDIGELNGRRVGVSEGTSAHGYLKEKHPDLILVPVHSSLNGMKMVRDGRLDAFVDTLEVLGYLINTHGFFDLKVSLRLEEKRALCMAFRKGMAPELLTVVNKGIQSVTPDEKNGFYRRWISLRVEEKINYDRLWKIGLPVVGVISIIVFIITVWNRRLAREIEVRKKMEASMNDALNVITASIRYASRIQRSVLPSKADMEALLDAYFVLWKPRDLVGGDIYWGTRWGGGTLVLLADCTGHGVPGAFMTLISTGALDRALIDVKEGDVAALIQKMHRLIQNTLSQRDGCHNENSSDEGLELGICYLPEDKTSLTFAGAGIPLFVFEEGDVRQIKGDRKGIGYRTIPYDSTWANHVLSVKSGLRFYMASDGIFDQVGGPNRIGFGKKRFMKLISSIQNMPLPEQGEIIYQTLVAYQGREKRRDDISALGFSL